MREIESADVLQMADSSSEDLLREIRAKHQTVSIAKIVAWLTAGTAGLLLLSGAGLVAVGGALVVGAVAVAAGRYADQIRKSVVLFYDFDPETEAGFHALQDGFKALQSAQRLWHIAAEGDVHDRKRNAGASTVVKRQPVRTTLSGPPFLKTNVDVPSLPAGRQTLYFLPDRLLVYDRENVGAVSYLDLRLDREPTRFIEDGGIPGDSQVVGRTWRYVNKKGGPDKRFKDNRELPICLYEEVHLSSGSGLNERFQTSRVGAAAALESAVARLTPPVLAPVAPVARTSASRTASPSATESPDPERPAVSTPRIFPAPDVVGGRSGSDRYFRLLEELQAAQTARDYPRAVRLARESLPVLRRWVQEEKRSYGKFEISSIPCLQVAGTLMAVLGDRNGLHEMRAVVREIPDLAEWEDSIDAHEADADLVEGILAAVRAEPGLRQRDLKVYLGTSDGRRPSTLADWLGKAGRIRRERDGSTYRLYPTD